MAFLSYFHYGPNLSNADWSNTAFHKDLASNSQAFTFMISSWIEQRKWGIEWPISSLKAEGPPHPLLPFIDTELAALV